MESDIKQKMMVARDELRAKPHLTYRNTSEAMESHLYQINEVLDHGFLRVVDYMGNEQTICQSARVSYGRGTKASSSDIGLLRYLIRHWHTTPLEACEIHLHVKLPIFVARQWIRHRTANVNEYSGRYSIMDKEFYIPANSRLGIQSKDNKQGTDTNEMSYENQVRVLDILKRSSNYSFDGYDELIDENDLNLSRELARIGLTINCYTQWYWKIDLKNLLHFIALRSDLHSQYEIRVYSDIILRIVSEWVPNVISAWNEYHPLRGAVNFSGGEYAALVAVFKALVDSGMGKADIRAMMTPTLKGDDKEMPRCSNREIKAFYTQLGLQK